MSVDKARPVWARRKRLRNRKCANEDPYLKHAVDVGNALHALRIKQNLTIRALAEKSGLSTNTLSLIENAKTSPSVATLQQLAVALDLPITAFFENGAAPNRVAYIKLTDDTAVDFAHGTLKDLGAGLPERMIEPFVVTMKPSASSGSQPIVHTGCEFVYCLEGRIVYTIEDKNYLLEPGDSLLFQAYLPHRWQNVELMLARAILVLCSAEPHNQSTQRHFLPESFLSH